LITPLSSKSGQSFIARASPASLYHTESQTAKLAGTQRNNQATSVATPDDSWQWAESKSRPATRTATVSSVVMENSANGKAKLLPGLQRVPSDENSLLGHRDFKFEPRLGSQLQRVLGGFQATKVVARSLLVCYHSP